MSKSELLDDEGIPFIKTILAPDEARPMHHLYERSIRQCLSTVVPKNFFLDLVSSGLSEAEVLTEFNKKLPLLTRVKPDSAPGTLTFTLLSRMRHNAFRFFYEMICRWLVPGKRLDVQFFYAADFQILDFGDQVYTLCDLMIKVRDEAELEEIRRNLPILETELLIGTDDPYLA